MIVKKLSLLMFIFFISVKVSGRLFFVGSFPYLSIIAFPQDINFFRYNYLAYTISYQSLPWYGDVDEVANRPNDSYVATDQNITFVKDDDDSETSYFQQYSSLYRIKHTIDYFKITPSARWYFLLKYQTDSMSSTVDANLKAEDDSGNISYIPVDYSLLHKANKYYLMSIIGLKYNKIPIGIKLGLGKETSGYPDSLLKTELNGTKIESKRLFWGWTTVGCNHIFGYKHINGDAWFENNFAIGPSYRYDLQLGVTIDNFRMGTRFRYINSVQEQYRWNSAGTNTIIEKNFNGEYEKQKWAKKSDEYIYRIYSNVTFDKSKYFKFNTLFFFGYSDFVANNILSENMEFKNDSQEKYKSYTLELNPNINISIGRLLKIDTAILLEYNFTKYENTYDRWNSVIGAETTAYWDTSVYIGDEYYWEDFSYANEHFIDLGWETDFSTPIYRRKNEILTLLTMVMINSKFTYKTKYYGENEDTENSIIFNVNNTRQNTRREIWLNTTISIFYKKNRIHFRFDFIEPLIYSKYISTKVLDTGNNILYNNEKSNQLAIQEGSQLVFSIGYQI